LTQVEAKETTYKIPFNDSEVEVHVVDRGEGQPFLFLHGGAGPASITGFANLMAQRHDIRVLTPTHPGFAGTPRPDRLDSATGLAGLYSKLLHQMGLTEVTVIGNSLGGRIAAEMAILGTPEVSRMILIDAVGIEVSGHPVAEVFKLAPDELMRLSYHDPTLFRVDPTKLTDIQRAIFAANRVALNIYGGEHSTDPSLLARLGHIMVPTLVIWGDSDRVVDTEYGRVFAGAIPGAKFLVLQDTGHVPQIETPDKLLDAIWNYAKR
jgi:pimeloyl-ACP methyl ester carboxylesterase